MMDGVIGDEELKKKYLEVIHRETLRLSRLIHDLLDLSLMESKKIEWEVNPLSLPQMIDQVLLKLMPQIEDKKIQIKKDFPSQLPLVLGNMDRIEQVLINLLSNALLFSPPESTVEIKVWEEAVSYTHLDVYKRQLPNRLLNWLSNIPKEEEKALPCLLYTSRCV